MSRRKKHEARVPISVVGGIRSQAKRGRHVRHWWGQRWISLLENIMAGPRLGRGRSYAAAGQVAELSLESGRVTAVVQGASPEPYRVVVRFRELDAAGRKKITEHLHHQPLLAAQLLIRELPAELEKIFRDAGCPLLPEEKDDFFAECSCPDWGKPCKHAAAVGFLLAEAVDRDPLLLLALRGIGRTELLGGQDAAAVSQPEALPVSDVIAATPAAFWGATGITSGQTASESPDFGPAPPVNNVAPLLQRLGPLPFWRGEERFLATMNMVCVRAASRGWTVWSGERLEQAHSATSQPGAGLRPMRRRLHMDLTMR